MKKLQSAQSYVYSIMDKLGPVREALVQKDDEWEEWGLEELVESLRKYTDRNPLPETSSQNQDVKKPVGSNQGNQWRRGEKMFMSGPNRGLPRLPPPCAPCAYCNSHQHRSSECTKILDFASRREFLKTNTLCFNCTKFGYALSSANPVDVEGVMPDTIHLFTKELLQHFHPSQSLPQTGSMGQTIIKRPCTLQCWPK